MECADDTFIVYDSGLIFVFSFDIVLSPLPNSLPLIGFEVEKP